MRAYPRVAQANIASSNFTSQDFSDKLYLNIDILNEVEKLPTLPSFNRRATNDYNEFKVSFPQDQTTVLSNFGAHRSVITDQTFSAKNIGIEGNINCSFRMKNISIANPSGLFIAGIQWRGIDTKYTSISPPAPDVVGIQNGDYTFNSIGEIYKDGAPQPNWTNGAFDTAFDKVVNIEVFRPPIVGAPSDKYFMKISYSDNNGPTIVCDQLLEIDASRIANETFSFLIGCTDSTNSQMTIDIVALNTNNYSYEEGLEDARAVFKTRRVNPLIERPNEYEVCVSKAKVPTQTIPLFKFQENTFSVGMSYQGVVYEKYVQWIPDTFPDSANRGKYLYNVYHFLEMYNKTIEETYQDIQISIAPTPMPNLSIPRVVFDPITELFTMTGSNMAEWDYGTSELNIHTDPESLRLFSGFRFFGDNENNSRRSEYIWVLKDGENTQTSTSISRWWDLSSIIFESYAMNIDGEDVANSNAIKRKIVLDFNPREDTTLRRGNDIIINPDIFRFHDINTKFPLTEIDINILWKDRLGNEEPVFLLAGDSANCKLFFRRKDRPVKTLHHQEF